MEQDCRKDIVTDHIKSVGKINQYQDCHFGILHASPNIASHFKERGYSAVARSKTRLQRAY